MLNISGMYHLIYCQRNTTFLEKLWLSGNNLTLQSDLEPNHKEDWNASYTVAPFFFFF